MGSVPVPARPRSARSRPGPDDDRAALAVAAHKLERGLGQRSVNLDADDPRGRHVEARGISRWKAIHEEVGPALPRYARHADDASGRQTATLDPHPGHVAKQVAEDVSARLPDLLFGDEVAPSFGLAPLELPAPLLGEARLALNQHRIELHRQRLELEVVVQDFAVAQLQRPRGHRVPDRPHLQQVIARAQAVPGETALAIGSETDGRAEQRDAGAAHGAVGLAVDEPADDGPGAVLHRCRGRPGTPHTQHHAEGKNLNSAYGAHATCHEASRSAGTVIWIVRAGGGLGKLGRWRRDVAGLGRMCHRLPSLPPSTREDSPQPLLREALDPRIEVAYYVQGVVCTQPSERL